MRSKKKFRTKEKDCGHQGQSRGEGSWGRIMVAGEQKFGLLGDACGWRPWIQSEERGKEERTQARGRYDLLTVVLSTQ